MIVIFFQSFEKFFNAERHAASIGIIGGADGPTAIFVTGKITGQLLLEIFSKIFLFILLLMLYKPAKLFLEEKNP